MSKKHKAWKRSKKFNKHHMKNRCRGGQTIESNLLLMDTERHDAFHFLFGNLDFNEIIELLKRVKAKKDSLKITLNL